MTKQGQCKLCLQLRDLQNSHLMPAALYRKSRNPGASNPNPMQVTERRSVQTSRQLRNYVLCRDCEQLFSRRGENYVMTQVFDGNSNRFPLLDMLRASTPSWLPGPEFTGYDMTSLPGVDREQLGYFAASAFWRASVHIWREPGEKPVTIDLGTYNEPFRQYLLGQNGFPANVAMLIIVCTDTISRESFYTPSLGRTGNDRTYSFIAKGLNFLMVVGKQVPQELRNLCAVTGARKLILARDCEAKTLSAFHRLMREQ